MVDCMGESEELRTRLIRAVDDTAEEVGSRFSNPQLARLWAAEVVRAVVEQLADDLLAQARTSDLTWEELGLALGMSPQGARQRHLRRVRGIVELQNRSAGWQRSHTS